MPNPFDQFIVAQQDQLGDAQAELDFESNRVEFVLKQVGFTARQLGALRAESRRRTDQGILRAHIFNELCPGFPFRLFTSRLRGIPLPYGPGQTPKNYAIHRDEKCIEAKRFARYDWVPYVIEFRRVQALPGAAGRATALMFPRKGLLHGMVVHDAPDYFEEGLAWVYKPAGRAAVNPDEQLVTQPCSLWLNTLAGQVEPNDFLAD